MKRCVDGLPEPRGEGRLVRARRAAERFFFTPARAEPLAVLRIGLALVLLGQAAMIAPVFFALHERSGILQGPVQDALARPGLPRIGWLIQVFERVGIGESLLLPFTGIVYVSALGALLVGWRTRVAAVVAWLSHLTLLMTANGMNYGVDEFAHIFLFYLIWVPSERALSLDRRAGRAPLGPTATARLALRVIQVHLCIVYLSSGVQKSLGAQWWNGDAIWRSLMLPDYRQYDFGWLASHPWVARLSGWTVIAVECGYAFLIWPRRTRRLWVLATAAMHLGIALFMGLGVFGAIMIVFTIGAFGVSAESTGALREPWSRSTPPGAAPCPWAASSRR